MDRTIAARLLRLLIVGAGVVAVFTVLVGGLAPLLGPEQAAALLPFAVAAVLTAGLGAVLPRIDRWVQRRTHHRTSTPYSALAEAAARIRAGTLAEALPGLAQVLAEGTGAQRAVLWLTVEDRLVSAAVHPPGDDGPVTVENLAVLLARPDTDHVVPVLDGPALRAALAIGKPGAPITPADLQLMADIANGAGSLLREVQRGTELEQRVRRADELAGELARSRQRLSRARDVERRRLVGELSHATADRLTALRGEFERAITELASGDVPAGQVRATLHRARAGLDELLERFRSIARGIYPAVLRDQGPAGALDELVADLPRPVRIDAELDRRLDWEIESGIYYLTASALAHLAVGPRDPALHVRLALGGGRLSARIEDPAPGADPDDLRAALAIDAERLAALGGELELTRDDAGTVLHAWLPDRLEPLVDGPGTRGDHITRGDTVR
ncbi:MAG: hypothetical protein L0I76_26395 [Pseudonocardia sp.]|nr:hypothetical protein [Pseudonocardia sp.]